MSYNNDSQSEHSSDYENNDWVGWNVVINPFYEQNTPTLEYDGVMPFDEYLTQISEVQEEVQESQVQESQVQEEVQEELQEDDQSVSYFKYSVDSLYEKLDEIKYVKCLLYYMKHRKENETINLAKFMRKIPLDIRDRIMREDFCTQNIINMEYLVNSKYFEHLASGKYMCDFDINDPDIIPILHLDSIHPVDYLRIGYDLSTILPPQYHKLSVLTVNKEYHINERCKLFTDITVNNNERVTVELDDDKSHQYVDLKYVPKVEQLNIYGFRIMNLDLCKNLVNLVLENTHVKFVHDLPNLKTLNVTGINFNSLYNLDKLERLVMENTSVTDINHLQQLKTIYLESVELKMLHKFHKVTNIECSDVRFVETLDVEDTNGDNTRNYYIDYSTWYLMDDDDNIIDTDVDNSNLIHYVNNRLRTIGRI
jgi:hypothetical protein